MCATAKLECPHCRWQTVCGPAEMLDWLRKLKMVRRDAAPEPELLPELFRAAAGRFACPQCQAVGLAIGAPDDKSDEAWGMARKCDACGHPIARERLEVFPETRLCVECQAASDRGDAPAEAEYCPRCGSVMTIRQSRRGLTRYVMSCPHCRS